MLRTILDNLTKRIEILEEKYACSEGIALIHCEQIDQLLNKCADLESVIVTFHVVSDKPIELPKRGRPKVSHVIGKPTKSNT